MWYLPCNIKEKKSKCKYFDSKKEKEHGKQAWDSPRILVGRRGISVCKY